jgi:hypothetical protein
MILKLLTQVALREDIPELNLTKSSIGTIVESYSTPEGQETGYSIEGLIALDTVEVSESQIEPIAPPIAEVWQVG